MCISINHVVAHGIPKDQVIKEGDLVTLDIAVESLGWYSDGAWTYICGRGDETRRRLLRAAWSATAEGIRRAQAGGRMGDIGEGVTGKAASFGCHVLKEFVGHGIGFEVHEEPNVPYFGRANSGSPIVPGMVLTIEPIVSLEDTGIKTLGDGWTVVTEDGTLTAQFEHTIAVFGRKTEVLTLPTEYRENYPDYPPY